MRGVFFQSMSRRTIFITGGARSGKSSFAENLAKGVPGKRAYLATAQALDPEMAARIDEHRKNRGTVWDTFEEPLAVADLLRKLDGRYQLVLLDCLTLWLSNVIARSAENVTVLARADELVETLAGFGGTAIIVSNEVGLGIVPENVLARRFRDLAGTINQRMAKAADEAYFLASGIPMRIK